MGAKIIVQRSSAFLNRMRPVSVFIDDADRGILKNNATEEYAVEAGNHKVTCKLNFYRSNEMNVALAEGETAYLRVRMGMQYFGVTYIILMLAILSDFLPRIANFPRPDWWSWGKLAIVVPVILYYLYYLTIGKKHYLVLEEDHKNIFR